MSAPVYNALTLVLIYGGLTALGLAVVYFIAAIVGWPGPFRKFRLMMGTLLLLAFPTCVALQQVLLYQIFPPSFAREAKREVTIRNEASSIVHVGDQAPSFRLKQTDESEFALEDLRGKVVLVNFFATWCGPCLMELPHMQEIWDQHHANSKFALVAIGREETAGDVKLFQSKHSYTFPMAADPDRAVYELYAKQSIPRTYLIDAEGRICYASVGFDKFDNTELTALKAEVDKQLSKVRLKTP